MLFQTWVTFSKILSSIEREREIRVGILTQTLHFCEISTSHNF